jgi:hypothetical protein
MITISKARIQKMLDKRKLVGVELIKPMYLECIVMQNDEVLCLGKIIGYKKDLEKFMIPRFK